jgi:competence protein CoiA
MKKYENKDVDCLGLLNGYAIREKDQKKINIQNAVKEDGKLYCEKCYSEAVIKKGEERSYHFAHKAKTTKVIDGNNESQLHYLSKEQICNNLKNIFPNGNWQTERVIPKKNNMKELVPDISGRINGVPIAIEVQKSPYTIKRIVDKTIEYAKRKIYVLWIVPIIEEIKEIFRPRLYERFLHSMYYGRTYYYVFEKDIIVPIHYGKAKKYIEFFEFYEQNGQHVSGGDYYKTYKTIKTPVYGEYIDFKNNFIPYKRLNFNHVNSKKNVPECYILKDNLCTWWDNEWVDIDLKKENTFTNSNFKTKTYFKNKNKDNKKYAKTTCEINEILTSKFEKSPFKRHSIYGCEVIQVDNKLFYI